MKNLNKENFWNGMQERFPNAMKLFCEWIDDYKKEVNWDEMFRNEIKIVAFGHNIECTGQEEYKIKFHHIPFEMQVGVLSKFFSEHGFIFGIGTTSDIEKTKYAIEIFFKEINRR